MTSAPTATAARRLVREVCAFARDSRIAGRLACRLVPDLRRAEREAGARSPARNGRGPLSRPSARCAVRRAEPQAIARACGSARQAAGRGRCRSSRSRSSRALRRVSSWITLAERGVLWSGATARTTLGCMSFSSLGCGGRSRGALSPRERRRGGRRRTARRGVEPTTASISESVESAAGPFEARRTPRCLLTKELCGPSRLRSGMPDESGGADRQSDGSSYAAVGRAGAVASRVSAGRSTQQAHSNRCTRVMRCHVGGAADQRSCPCLSPTLRPWITDRPCARAAAVAVLRGGALEPEARALSRNRHAKVNAKARAQFQPIRAEVFLSQAGPRLELELPHVCITFISKIRLDIGERKGRPG